MKRVKLWIDTNMIGDDCYDEYIEVPDETTEEELQAMAVQYMSNIVSCGFTILEDDEEF